MRQSGILQRAVAIVEYVAQSGAPVSVTELIRSLDLPKPSAHRICRTLEEMGVLMSDPVARGMTIGPRLSRIALDTLLTSAEDGERRRILRSVVEETGETCTLTVLDRDEVLCLDRVESSSPMQLQLYAGSHVPLTCTASGKLFLAFLPKTKRSKMIRVAPLKRHTENTITDPETLELELEAIRKKRLSSDNQEFLRGLVAIAVPIFDSRRTMCAALSLNAPVGRMSIENSTHHVTVLRSAASSLSSLFNGSLRSVH
jgi:IclR family transcriptional regulator, acetate operon repressor